MASLQITGFVQDVTPVEEFGAKGFKKCNVIVTDNGNTYCFECFGDALNDIPAIGANVTVHFRIRTNAVDDKYGKTKYYTSLNVVMIVLPVSNSGATHARDPFPDATDEVVPF